MIEEQQKKEDMEKLAGKYQMKMLAFCNNTIVNDTARN